MIHLLRFSVVLVAFVASVAGITWTTASAERHIGTREYSEREAAGGMLDALLARESALRGFAESGGEGFLQPYDEATAALAAAADRARSFAKDDDEKTASIADQERIAERWAGIANDAVIRIRNGRPVSAVSTASRNDLIERFEKDNDKLVEMIEAESAKRHADAVERAVLSDRPAQRRIRGCRRPASEPDAATRDAAARSRDAQYHASQREFAETLAGDRERG